MKSESLIPDKDLEDKCKHLERLVEHHTAELTASSEKLQKEIVRRKKAEAALREGEEKYRQLFDQASVLYPYAKALYMSGYTRDVIAHRGVIDAGVNFIQKPFSVKLLATRVREVLDQT